MFEWKPLKILNVWIIFIHGLRNLCLHAAFNYRLIPTHCLEIPRLVDLPSPPLLPFPSSSHLYGRSWWMKAVVGGSLKSLYVLKSMLMIHYQPIDKEIQPPGTKSNSNGRSHVWQSPRLLGGFIYLLVDVYDACCNGWPATSLRVNWVYNLDISTCYISQQPLCSSIIKT